ncbi:class I SAM-dependent methyltransferase [Zunongwangia sp. H14]|uniref:class I SAM-dependent methyltransferase n=1 Tax=Zunongwangia sp. H14 TaxID=3240792 RepID=UPI003569CCB3
MSGEAELNKKQKEFYETFRKNRATKIWYTFRNGMLRRMRKDFGVENQIYKLHREWLGDLSNKKVLDLGCYAGNSLSYYLAENSREYLGIDLSERGIAQLKKRISKVPGARAVAIDFLSEEFEERDFDLIYAYGVLHHFRDTDKLILRIKEKLKIGGEIISYDPLQTSLPIKILRSLYRPFQSDRAWEWPFSRKVYYKYQQAFQILERRAVFGKSKWLVLVNLLPLSNQKKQEVGQQWHRHDWKLSLNNDAVMFSCMHLTMRMKYNSR